MERSRPRRLDELIREFFRSIPAAGKMKEMALVGRWEEVVGAPLARHTKKIYLKNKVLYVYLDSSVVRNELFMMREMLLNRLNEAAGERLVERIVLR